MSLGAVDQTDALKGVISLQNVYKLSTSDVGNAMNFLSSAQASTSATMGELIQAMPKVGPLAVSLGASYKQVVAMLVAMREGGITAAEGANALKSAMGSLINPTKVATAMFSDFGIDLRGIVTKNAGNLTQTLLIILSIAGIIYSVKPKQKNKINKNGDTCFSLDSDDIFLFPLTVILVFRPGIQNNLYSPCLDYYTS